MASQNTKIHLRSITIIGAGAAVLAVIGYLLMKSDSRKKSKKKVKAEQQCNNTTETTAVAAATTIATENQDEQSGGLSSNHEINETEEINKLCDLYTKSAFNHIISKSPPPASETIMTKPYINNNNKALVGNDEAIVPISSLLQSSVDNNKHEENTHENEYCAECCMNKQNTINNLDQNFDLDTNNLMNSMVQESTKPISNSEQNAKSLELVNDKLSETSSDSGNGTSELLIAAHSPHEVEYDEEREQQQCIISKHSKNSPESTHSNENNDEVKTVEEDSTNNIINTTEDENNNSKPSIPESTSTMSISSTTQPQTDIIVYEFHFPRKYCGKLIGRNGVHVDYIRNKTHVQIAVRNDPDVEDLQIVCLTGYISDVDQALDIISARFPYRHYPQISFKPIRTPIVCRRNRIENNKVLVSANMYVQLTSNKNYQTDVNVSAIVTPTHLFIQLPSQPTYPLLQRLDEDMLHLYSTSDKTIPGLPTPIEYGTICAAPTSYGWHRAMVTEYYISDSQPNFPYYTEQIEMATVKFLDYGGYLNIPVSQLKQLRTDFMTLPFQAIEVFLDGVFPIEGLEENGKNLISKLIRDSPLKAVVTGYTEDRIPLVKLFLVNNPQKSSLINNELVINGYARKITAA